MCLKSLNSDQEVLDVDWSPFKSTSFSVIKKDGAFELWDLQQKSYDPIQIIKDQDK